jgi:hypothetical protein
MGLTKKSRGRRELIPRCQERHHRRYATEHEHGGDRQNINLDP